MLQELLGQYSGEELKEQIKLHKDDLVPKHIIIDRDKSDNEYYTRLFAKEQSYRSMLRILGY